MKLKNNYPENAFEGLNALCWKHNHIQNIHVTCTKVSSHPFTPKRTHTHTYIFCCFNYACFNWCRTQIKWIYKHGSHITIIKSNHITNSLCSSYVKTVQKPMRMNGILFQMRLWLGYFYGKSVDHTNFMCKNSCSWAYKTLQNFKDKHKLRMYSKLHTFLH